MWDYPRRTAWRRLRHMMVVREPAMEPWLWWMFRANGRGMYALSERMPWLTWMLCVGWVEERLAVVCHPVGRRRLEGLRARLLGVVTPDKRAWLGQLSERYAKPV